MRRAFVGPFGILGDRRHAVVGPEGDPLTARRAHALLGFRAACADPDAGEGVQRDHAGGLGATRWTTRRWPTRCARALGYGVSLVRSALGVHDAAPVHLLTSASLTAAQELGRRRRRSTVAASARTW